jgi:hypothetical protein
MSNSTEKANVRSTTLMGLTTLVALTALLSACGGGGSGGAAAPTEPTVEHVPTAASQGVSVFAGWLKQMSTESMDGKDSMNTSTFTPTVQEDVEPVAAPL